MKAKRGLSFILLMVFLLAGCMKDFETKASTYLPILKNTETHELIMSKTPAPALTFTYIPSPTPFPFNTTQAGWLSEISPNGEWGVWFVPVGACGNKLFIMNLLDESLTWKLGYQETLELTGTIDLVVYPEQWSVDGQYFYFITDLGCIDGGPAFQGVSSLKRLNLVTGNIIDILPPGGINAKISSNSQYLALINYDQITIRDLSTGKEKSIIIVVPNSFSRGDIKWSPDNNRFIFAVQTANEDFSIFAFTLVLVDITTMEYEILFEDVGYSWFNWEDNETIFFQITIHKNDFFYTLNTTTGEITEVEE